MSVTLIANLVVYTDMVYPYKLYFQTSDDITRFNDFVTKWQYNILTDLMGDEIYNDFRDGLLASPVLQKWTDLRDGKTYDSCFSCNEKNYRGIVYTIVPKLYAEWILENQQFAAITGNVIFQNENSREPNMLELKKASNKAHNEFVKRYNRAYDFMISESYDTVSMCHKTERKRDIVTKTTIR